MCWDLVNHVPHQFNSCFCDLAKCDEKMVQHCYLSWFLHSLSQNTLEQLFKQPPPLVTWQWLVNTLCCWSLQQSVSLICIIGRIWKSDGKDGWKCTGAEVMFLERNKARLMFQLRLLFKLFEVYILTLPHWNQQRVILGVVLVQCSTQMHTLV